MTKAPFFPSAKLTTSLSSIYTPGKPSPIDSVTVVTTRSPVEILKRSPKC